MTWASMLAGHDALDAVTNCQGEANQPSYRASVEISVIHRGALGGNRDLQVE